MAKTTTELAVPAVFKIGDAEINRDTLIAQRNIDVKHVITGVSDTAGYKKAVELRGLYRTTRTTLEKMRKELSAPHQAYIKKLKETTDDLGAEAYKGEQYFDEQIATIDNEKERIKQEKILEQQRRVSARVSELTACGASFDGEYYTFPYSEDIATALTDLQSWSDETYNAHLEDVKTAWAAEQTRLHEAKVKEEEAEQERQAAALLVQQQAEANEQKEKELRLQKERVLAKEIKLLGGVLQEDDTYLFPGKDKFHLAPLSALVEYSDEAWESIVTEIEAYVPPVVEEVTVKPDFDPNGLNDKLEEAYRQGHMVEPLGVAGDLNPEFAIPEFIAVQFNFRQEEPFTDIYITPKMFVRVYPSEYESLATAGFEWANTGKLQGLNWAVTKR